MLSTRPALTAAELGEGTGWTIEPRGACRDEVCVPLGDLDTSGPIPLADFAAAMDMPLVHDDGHGLWALGPRHAGSVLDSARVPDLVLDDFAGDAFDLAELRGRKVLLLAWASW